jgi:hypothetical protein
LKGFLARGFTKIRKNPNASAKKCSQATQDTQGQGPCSNGDSTDNSEGLCDAKSCELKCRRSLHGSSLLHLMRQRASTAHDSPRLRSTWLVCGSGAQIFQQDFRHCTNPDWNR